MKKFKALLVVACALLLVAASVFGTMAYLTSTDTVTNTFTVGKVAIKLDEAKVNPDGSLVENADRVKANSYKLLPGHIYNKDPMVTVEDDSEESYVRMKVEVENIDQLKAVFTDASYYGANGVFLLQKLVGGWDNTKWASVGYEQSKDGKTGTYEFRYYQKTGPATLVPLFTTITIPGSVDAAGLEKLGNVKINITGEAIQADGFANADTAWTAFNNK